MKNKLPSRQTRNNHTRVYSQETTFWPDTGRRQQHKSPPQHELGLVAGTRTGNALFNNALNTFYLWLYGVGEHEQITHLLYKHSQNPRIKPIPQHE